MHIKLIHNGTNISFHENMTSVNNYIDSVLHNYAHLRPRKVVDTKHNSNIQVIVYEYYTFYCEMFMIVTE